MFWMKIDIFRQIFFFNFIIRLSFYVWYVFSFVKSFILLRKTNKIKLNDKNKLLVIFVFFPIERNQFCSFTEEGVFLF